MQFILLPWVGAISIVAFFIILRQRNELVVKANSSRYRKILCLNEEQEFYKLPDTCYQMSYTINSKKSYDKVNLDEYFMYMIEKNDKNIASIIKRVEENNKRYHLYCSKYKSIKSEVTPRQLKEYKISYKGFRKLEDKICERVMLHPRLKIDVCISVAYTSPKGHNAYEKHQEYSYNKVKELYDKVIERIKNKESLEYQKKIERLKMTDSLRYDILWRDGYKCQICGITAKDGAKLHVDHIIPIAKGGKTVPENLQTLCDRCNLGKSDKYYDEPNMDLRVVYNHE